MPKLSWISPPNFTFEISVAVFAQTVLREVKFRAAAVVAQRVSTKETFGASLKNAGLHRLPQ